MSNSASGMKTALLCMQKWDYIYNHKREPIDSGSFEASYGQEFHKLREGIPTTFFGDKWTAVLNAHDEAYVNRWSEKYENYWNVNYIEHELKFQFILADQSLYDGIYEYNGIVDAVVELNGEMYLLETKTTGADLERFSDRIRNQLQPKLYLLAAAESDILRPYDIQGIIIDATRRPGCRQKRTETDKQYVERVTDWYWDNKETAFRRTLITATDDELSDLSAEIMLIKDMQDRKQFVKNRDACYAYNKQCGFYAVCFEGASLSNDALYQIRKRR